MVAAKQTNILRDTETEKDLDGKHAKWKKYILTNKRTSRLTVDTCTQGFKKNKKLGALC